MGTFPESPPPYPPQLTGASSSVGEGVGILASCIGGIGMVHAAAIQRRVNRFGIARGKPFGIDPANDEFDQSSEMEVLSERMQRGRLRKRIKYQIRKIRIKQDLLHDERRELEEPLFEGRKIRNEDRKRIEEIASEIDDLDRIVGELIESNFGLFER